MSLLHLKQCDYREFSKEKNEIVCKKDGSIKSVENCIECMMEMT